MLTKSVLLKYYKRKDVQEALVAEAQHREVGVCFGLGRFGKRPEVLPYPKDVLEFVLKGATSFHCSEERWTNPLLLGPEMRPGDLAELRSGWDLLLDIDCKELEYSKIAADLLVQALMHHGISTISVKFSGNHGFHIGVPFETFPPHINNCDVKTLFPEGPRRIAAYLKNMIREHLVERLLSVASLSTMSKNTDKSIIEITKNGTFDPFTIVDIDTILISSRHLFRMTYSFNEKSGLVSIPIDPRRVLQFDRKKALPPEVCVDRSFLNVASKKNEATQLFVQAFDDSAKTREEHPPKEYTGEFIGSEMKIPEQYFPPCITLILQGLRDGKKRALFALVNFLTSVGWNYDEIETRLKEWNAKNPEPLREVNLVGQLRYHKQMKKKILPPNCNNRAYYLDLQVCKPDSFCSRIKNPANYAILKQKIAIENAPKPRKQKARKEPENTPAAPPSPTQKNS